jgi:hypothetical protein
MNKSFIKIAESAFGLLAMTTVAFAWDNPNKSAAPRITVAADKPSTLKLENRRVKSIDGNTFTYDTGRKVLTITADSTKSRIFLDEVKSGRISAHASVNLIPQRQSPFNTEYKAR